MQDFLVNADITKAKTLPTSFYTETKNFSVAREKVFKNSWQFIGDITCISKSNNCFPFLLLDPYLKEPLLLTKDNDGKLHCMSNVCTHRGNLVIDESCNTSNLRCKYHGRLFRLDGTMVSMPEFKGVADFPSVEDDLKSLPLFQWGNLLFTSISDSMKAENFLGEMIQRLSWLPLEQFKSRPDLSKDYYVKAHWALYCENYLEGFHIPFVHSALNAVIDYGSYTTELFTYSNLQLGIAKENEDCFDLPSSSTDYGSKIAAYYFWVFPNMMFNFYPWGLSINIVQPLTIDTTKVSFLTYMWKEDKYNRGAGSDLDKVEMEDEAIVQNVQKGINSSFYKQGRYSPNREQGTHHFHRLIAEFMNK
jgi:Phenylpropionate dioxygenase and related ring-hydroxylating dioxygenases, large terminal subunit